MKTSILTIVALLFLTLIKAQSISSEITKINHYYDTKEALEIHYSYQLYMNEKTTEPTEQKFVVMYKQGKKQYMKFDQLESITTPDFNLYIDHASKQVILTQGPTPFGKQEDPAAGLTATISKMLTYCSDTSLSKKGSVGSIKLSCETSQFDKIVVQYGLSNYALKKLVLQMRKNDLMEEGVHPKIVVVYSKIEKGGSLPPKIFSYEQFITTNSSGELKMKETMKGYTFSNYL